MIPQITNVLHTVQSIQTIEHYSYNNYEQVPTELQSPPSSFIIRSPHTYEESS